MTSQEKFRNTHCIEASGKMQEAVWIELRIPAAHLSEDSFASLTESMGCLGMALETDADTGEAINIAWFEAGDDIQRTRASIAAAALLQGISVEHVCISETSSGWETAWQKDWQAMPVGERLWVRPSFCELPADDRLDIVLDPGMAFGTGQHATTQLCLVAIERLCTTASIQSVLDMGCGSGLLAIASAKLGAGEILAIDNDPVAIEAACENARINNVEMRCLCSDTPPDRRFDLVVANILAGPLIEMAGPLAACVDKHLVLSGLLTEQVDGVAGTYRKHGLDLKQVDTSGEWAAISFCTGKP